MDQTFKQSMNQLSKISDNFWEKRRLWFRRVKVTWCEHMWRLFGVRSRAPLGIAAGLLILGTLFIYLTSNSDKNELLKHLT